MGHHPTTPLTVLRANEITKLSQRSFWDALIIASAEQAGAAQLYTEDLNAGQAIVGAKIINPLVADCRGIAGRHTAMVPNRSLDVAA